MTLSEINDTSEEEGKEEEEKDCSMVQNTFQDLKENAQAMIKTNRGGKTNQDCERLVNEEKRREKERNCK